MGPGSETQLQVGENEGSLALSANYIHSAVQSQEQCLLSQHILPLCFAEQHYSRFNPFY